MRDVYLNRLAALDDMWRLWGETGAGLTELEWTASTRCDGWDAAALYAHHSGFPVALSAAPPAVEGQAGEPLTAVEVLRGFNATGGVAHSMARAVADAAVADAASVTRAQLVERFLVHGAAAVRQLRQAEPGTLVPWPVAGLVPVVEALRIVLLEATVHLLDLLRALDRAPALPPEALRETAQLLAEVAPPVALIEAATGRTADSPLPVLR
jgi:uncharacterized protein (TIGR03083 family)